LPTITSRRPTGRKILVTVRVHQNCCYQRDAVQHVVDEHKGDGMAERLLVSLGADGHAAVLSWPDGEGPQGGARAPLAWPVDAQAVEDLGWYLEDYLRAPFGVWGDRGPAVRGKLATWGDQVFGSVFGSGSARFVFERAREKGLELVFRSANPDMLG